MLKPEQIASVKGRGFLINRGTECFSGRLVCAGAVFTAADLRTISEIAEKFGSGKVTFTSRLSAEIVGIPFEQIDAACDYAAERGLYFGGTGAKIRPVTACKLRVVTDRCSVELYADDGKFTLTLATVPDPTDISILPVLLDPGIGIDFEVHKLKSMWE